MSRRAQAQGTPIWMYEFRDQTAILSIGYVNGVYALSFPQGAAHSYELQYLFDLNDLQNAERRALSSTMTQYWTTFARTGNPNGAAVPQWSTFESGAVIALDVASGGGVTSRTPAQFATQHQCDTVWIALGF